MTRLAMGALLIALLPVAALGQGNEATSAGAQAESGDSRGEVQIGAGSTSAVTTGSSGPTKGSNDTVPPLAPPFTIVPPQQSQSGLYGPGPLAIRSTGELRCNIIGERNARSRCESRAAEIAGGKNAGGNKNE